MNKKRVFRQPDPMEPEIVGFPSKQAAWRVVQWLRAQKEEEGWWGGARERKRLGIIVIRIGRLTMTETCSSTS